MERRITTAAHIEVAACYARIYAQLILTRGAPTDTDRRALHEGLLDLAAWLEEALPDIRPPQEQHQPPSPCTGKRPPSNKASLPLQGEGQDEGIKISPRQRRTPTHDTPQD